MDFLNNTARQIADLFNSMTPGARITSGLLFAVVVVSLLYLFQFPVGRGDAYIFEDVDLSMDDRNMIAVALSKADLEDFEFTAKGVKVPSSKIAAYYKAVSEGDAVPTSTWNDAGILKSISPWISGRQQDELILHEKKRRVAKMIRALYGVEAVNIEYSENRSDGFPRTMIRKASVTVRKSLGRELEQKEASAIRRLVQGAFAGCESGDISIVDGKTMRSFSGPNSQGFETAEDSPYVQAKRFWEEDYEAKITERLREYDANVKVTVDLNTDVNEDSLMVVIDPTPTTVSTKSTSSETSTEKDSNRGRPGLATNGTQGTAGGVAQISSGGKPSLSTTSNKTEDNKMVPGKTVTRKSTVGLTLKSTRCSIGIPEAFYRRRFQGERVVKQNDTVESIELEYRNWLKANEIGVKEKVQEIVRPLLSGMEGLSDPYEFIVVHTEPSPQEITMEEPTMVDGGMVWLANNWQYMGMMLMGAASLVILRSTVKTALKPNAASVGATPLLESTDGDGNVGDGGAVNEEGEEDERENELLKRFTLHGPDLQDDLTEIVQQDPDAAAAVLKGWIGEPV